MTITKALIAIGSVTLSTLIGCANPAVTYIAPVPKAGSGGTSSPAAGSCAPPPAAGTGSVTPPMPTAGTGSVTPPMPVAGTGTTGGASGSSVMPQAGTSAGMSGPVAGTMSVAGASGAGTAGMMSVAGMGAPPAPGPCPSGWTCTDLSSLGATAVDGDGKPITTSCGNGALTDCKDADPKTSCPALSAPFCAHIKVAGMDLVSCGQHCTM
jgi:hypothetical protein